MINFFLTKKKIKKKEGIKKKFFQIIKKIRYNFERKN
jgi:hypothetical protein